MDIEEIAQELQRFADANGVQVDASIVVNEMDAGDFIVLNQAMDNSDNTTILKLLQKYKARVSENYNYFSTDVYTLNESVISIRDIGINKLHEEFKRIYKDDAEHLTLAEMMTLVYDALYEDNIPSQLKANQIVAQNTVSSQQNINPQTQAKMKQAELQRNANNSAMKVTVPGTQSGIQDVEPVVGVDPGSTPEQTLVVTKDTQKPNSLNVFGLDDVNPVLQQGQTSVTEEFSPGEINQDVMGPRGENFPEGGPSPLTNTAPGMGEVIQAIADIESEDDVYGDDSPLGNKSMEDENDIIRDIIDNCYRIRGR